MDTPFKMDWELLPEDEILVPCSGLKLGDCVRLIGCDHISCPCVVEKWYVIAEKAEDWPQWIALEYNGLGGYPEQRVLSMGTTKVQTIRKPKNIEYVVPPKEVRRVLDNLGYQFETWSDAVYVPRGVSIKEWVKREAELWAKQRFTLKLCKEMGERIEI